MGWIHRTSARSGAPKEESRSKSFGWMVCRNQHTHRLGWLCVVRAAQGFLFQVVHLGTVLREEDLLQKGGPKGGDPTEQFLTRGCLATQSRTPLVAFLGEQKVILLGGRRTRSHHGNTQSS